ncbi:hypothetical protein [Bradyrhizobium sp. USDA 3364]
MPQILQEVTAAKLSGPRVTCLVATLAAFIGVLDTLDAGFAAAQGLRKVAAAQIRARFVGVQLTDEVHYRFVFERDGTLRSVSAGTKKRGRWTIEKDQLCLYLGESDDGCYDVAQSGRTFTLTPTGPGLPADGILEPISDPQ